MWANGWGYGVVFSASRHAAEVVVVVVMVEVVIV